MSEDLQSLLEKINREGVEKAQAAADTIIADAKARAAAIVKEAETTAAQAKAEAKAAAEDYQKRAGVTVKQAARDIVIEVEKAVTQKLAALLAKDVKATLADPQSVTKLLGTVIGDFVKTGDVAVSTGKYLADTLKAQLASEKNITIVMDETQGTGFTVKLDGGRVEHAFTDKVITEELVKRLRPDLAALVR